MLQTSHCRLVRTSAWISRVLKVEGVCPLDLTGGHLPARGDCVEASVSIDTCDVVIKPALIIGDGSGVDGAVFRDLSVIGKESCGVGDRTTGAVDFVEGLTPSSSQLAKGTVFEWRILSASNRKQGGKHKDFQHTHKHTRFDLTRSADHSPANSTWVGGVTFSNLRQFGRSCISDGAPGRLGVGIGLSSDTGTQTTSEDGVRERSRSPFPVSGKSNLTSFSTFFGLDSELSGSHLEQEKEAN